MSKSTQNFRLHQLLKASGTGMVLKEAVAKELGVALASVPVYIHEFKKAHKADVTSVRNGRNVIGYTLVTKGLKVPEFRKNAASIVTKHVAKGKQKALETSKETVDGNGTAVPILDTDAAVLSDREVGDIKASLGVSGYSSGSRSNDS